MKTRPPTISPSDWAEMNARSCWPTPAQHRQALLVRRGAILHETDLGRDVRRLEEDENRASLEARELAI